MIFRVSVVALALSILPIVGCWGTTVNLVRSGPEGGGMVPFGGVKLDWMCIQAAANGDLGIRSQAPFEEEHYPHVAVLFFCGLDLPFSLLGDLVTWPYVETYLFINEPVPVPPVLQAPPVLLLTEGKTAPLPAPSEAKEQPRTPPAPTKQPPLPAPSTTPPGK